MEIVLRAAVVFIFLWVVTRAVGRSTLGELSTFELLLYVTMGDLVQQGVTQQDYSVTGAVLAVGTFALLPLAISWTQWRFPRSRAPAQRARAPARRSGPPRGGGGVGRRRGGGGGGGEKRARAAAVGRRPP